MTNDSTIQIVERETNGEYVDKFRSDGNDLSCIAPICPYSFMANRSFLKIYLPWIAKNTNHCVIVVGDYLERINIGLFQNKDEAAAIRKAMSKGRKISRFIDEILGPGYENSNISKLSCREYIERKETQDILQSLLEYGKQNRSFGSDVIEQTRRMAKNSNRVPDRCKPISDDQLQQLSQYMYEEIALYLALYQDGYHVEIYPGRDLDILQDIVAGKYENFPYEYRSRTHISVEINLYENEE